MLTGLGRMRIARVSGIPVHVHASWLIVLVLMVWTLAGWYFPPRGAQLGTVAHWIQGLCASLLVFASILVHEMGHAVVARRNGLGIRSVTLFVFGGVAQLEREAEDGGTEVRMALAGPAVSLVVAAVFGLAAGAPFLGAPARDVASFLALVNGGVVLFNLVPAFPLDGGRLLRGLLWNRIGKEPATRAAARGGSLFALFLMVMGALTLIQGAVLAGVWYFALGIFLKDAADRASSQASLDETLRGLRVRDVMLTDVETLAADLSVAEAASMHFRRTGYGSYPVTRGQVVVGLLCLRDVVQVPKSERVAVSIQAVMKPLSPALLAGADEALDTAMRRLVRNEAARLLVLENGRLVGLLTMSSLLRHIQVREELAASTLVLGKEVSDDAGVLDRGLGCGRRGGGLDVDRAHGREAPLPAQRPSHLSEPGAPGGVPDPPGHPDRAVETSAELLGVRGPRRVGLRPEVRESGQPRPDPAPFGPAGLNSSSWC